MAASPADAAAVPEGTPDALPWGTEACATSYDKMTDTHPQHRNVYMFNVFRALGDLSGLRVLDMPCGEGKYTCEMFARGAGHVTSVDICDTMLSLSRDRVAELGKSDCWSSVQGDVTVPLDALGSEVFDRQLANFLFEYSPTQEALENTARNLFRSMKPGGILACAYVPGAKGKDDIAKVREAVGIEATVLTPDIKPGDAVTVTYHRMNPPFTYTIYYWPVQMVAQAMEDAGFVDVEVHRFTEIDPSYNGEINLRQFVDHTGNRMLTARKPGPSA